MAERDAAHAAERACALDASEADSSSETQQDRERESDRERAHARAVFATKRTSKASSKTPRLQQQEDEAGERCRTVCLPLRSAADTTADTTATDGLGWQLWSVQG